MSTTPKGSYSSAVVYDERKRYYVMQAQANRPLLDSEVRGMNQSLLDMARRHMVSLLGNVASPLETFSSPTGASGPNNAFRVTASKATTDSNFTIIGGSGDVDDPAVLYLDGYYVFLKGDVEYNVQGPSLLPGETLQQALVRDSYTATPKSSFALTTPAGARTDVVYVDLSFAEVSGDAIGSEYTDPAIKDPVIGRGTANRLRAVIDFRVYEGWAGQADDNIYDDAFFGSVLEDQVQHVKYPIALLHRTAGNPNITESMIVDLLSRDEKRVLSVKELSHRTRHGGYTRADVDAGRAAESDLNETWSAPGKGEGLDTEAFNSDSVTPRVLDTNGHYRVSAISVGASGQQHSPNPELLTDGEVSVSALYARTSALGFSGATASDLRGMSGVVLSVDSRGTKDLAVRVVSDTSDVALRVDSGISGASSFEVRGSGRVGIGTGSTGPQCALDVVGDEELTGDLTAGGSADIGHEAFVGSRVSVGLSGIRSAGDISLLSKSREVGLHMGHTGAFGATGEPAAYWAHLVAKKDSLSIDSLNNSGSTTGERFTWSVPGSSGPNGKISIMGLDSEGDLRVAKDVTAHGDLHIEGSSEVLGDSHAQGKLTAEGGLLVNGVKLVDAGKQDSWYEIGSFFLGGSEYPSSGSLHIVLSSVLGTVGSWEADLFVSATIPPSATAQEGLYISGTIRSTSAVNSGNSVVEVLRSRSAGSDGSYRYSVVASTVYPSNSIYLSVIGGSLIGGLLLTPKLGAQDAIPEGIASYRQNIQRILGSVQVTGSLGVTGSISSGSDLTARRDLSVGRDASVAGTLQVGDAVRGTRLYMPSRPDMANMAFLGLTGRIAGYTGGVDHVIELSHGALAAGDRESWGSFMGTDESGQVGFRIGMGNPQAGRGRARGWVQSDMLTVVESPPALRGIIGIAFDTKGNCIAAIRDYMQDSATSIVYVDTITRRTALLASGFRAISDIKLSVDGFLYVSSELALSSQDYKVARVVLYYGPDGKPTSASVQPIALSTPVFGLAGIAVARAPMQLGSNSFPAGTLFVVESRVSSARLLAVDPVSGNTAEVLTNLANVSAIECGSVYGSDHAIYISFNTRGCCVMKVHQLSTGVVYSEPFGSFPSGDQEITCARKLHLGVDGYLYLVDASDTTGSGKVLRYDQVGSHDLVVSGLENTRAFCVNDSRMMYIGDTANGSLYRRATPGSLVVHLDYPTGADDYNFPGDIPLVPSAREVDITGVGADVVSVYGADFRVDRRLVVEGAAFFSKDVYVDGILHMDTMEVGDFRAANMIVGANAPKGYYWDDADGSSGASGVSGSSGSAGGVSALDVWGDAIVQSMLLVGSDPSGATAKNIVNAGMASSGGVSAYVFGEMQAYDYRAVGQGGSVGLLSLETSDGYIAAFIGGDDSSTYSQYREDGVAPAAKVYVDSAGNKVLGYSGASGASGASGSGGLFAFESSNATVYNKKLGIHLIDAASLIVDRDGGDVPAFMQVQGDLEVMRGISVRSMQCNAFSSRGISMKVSGSTIEDRTPVIRKDFASSTAVPIRASMNYSVSGNSTNPELSVNPQTLRRWVDSSCGPLGENLAALTPGLSSLTFGAPELTKAGSELMDSLDLASLGSIKIRWKGRRESSVIDIDPDALTNPSRAPGYYASPATSFIPKAAGSGSAAVGFNFPRNGYSDLHWTKKVILSYTFDSPIFGEQDWMMCPSASDTRSVTVDVSLAEPVHEASLVSRISSLRRTFQVYLPLDSWHVHASNAIARLGASTAALAPLWDDEPFYYTLSHGLTVVDVSHDGDSTRLIRETYQLAAAGAVQSLISFMSADMPMAYPETGNGLMPDKTPVAGATRFAATPAVISNPDAFASGNMNSDAGRAPILETLRWGSGWAVTLYPRFKTAYRVQVDSAGNFDWVGTWDLQISIVNTSATVNECTRDQATLKDFGKVRTASSINGYVLLADSASGSRPWSAVNPPWKLNEQLPWSDEMQIQAAINADKYVHVQGTSSKVWEVAHSLGGYPSVTLQDTSGDVFVADIQYTSQDTLVITLNVAAVGRAVLN